MDKIYFLENEQRRVSDNWINEVTTLEHLHKLPLGYIILPNLSSYSKHQD